MYTYWTSTSDKCIRTGVKRTLYTSSSYRSRSPEAGFVEVIKTKDFRVFLLLFTVNSINVFFSPPPPSTSPSSENGLKLVCNVNTVYGNLKFITLKIMARNLNEIVRSASGFISQDTHKAVNL
jgi:hypothetical protein